MIQFIENVCIVLKSFLCFFCGILVSCVILPSCDTLVKTYTVNFEKEPHLSDFIFIPVTINDSVFQFVFDTGASHNLIDSVLAQKMGLNTDSTVFCKITRHASFMYDTISFAHQNISIGNLKTNGIFAVKEFKGLSLEDIQLKHGIEAVLGMEIIGQFNWLFNFSDKTVTVSEDKIKTPTFLDDQILTFAWNGKSGITCVDLTLDDITIQNVIFDTGYGVCPIQFFDRNEKIDIVFSKTDIEAFNIKRNKQNVSVTIPIEEGKVIIFDSLKINNFTMKGIFALEQKDYYQTIITASFIRRFRSMYFDSQNKKIHLFASLSDSTRNQKKELQFFCRAINKIAKESRNDSLMIPASLIDSIWTINQ